MRNPFGGGLLVGAIVVGGLFAPSLLAGQPPAVYSVAEGEDPGTGRPTLAITGKSLTRYVSFALVDAGTSSDQGTPEVATKSSPLLVLRLPADLSPGPYVLTLTDKRGTGLDLAVSIRNGKPLPGSVGASALEPSLSASLGRNLVGAKVRRSGGLVVAVNVDTPVPFNEEEFDTDECHDNLLNPTRLTCRSSGYYLVTATANWGGNPVFGWLRIKRNGVTVQELELESGSSAPTIGQVHTIVFLAEDDYVEEEVSENAFGPSLTLAGGAASTEFSMVRIGE